MRTIKRSDYNLKRKAQMQISFQFIFSIILVAVVIFVGFYVIRMFLVKAEQVKLLDFIQELKTTVSDISDVDGSRELFNSSINSKILYICFANASSCNNPVYQDMQQFCSNISARYANMNYNMFFYPINIAGKYKVASAQEINCNGKNCVYIPKKPDRAICIPVLNGRVSMWLIKENITSPIKISPA